MSVTRKVIADLGSEVHLQMLEQINRLTAAVEALQAAIVTDAPTSITNVAAIDMTEFETFVTSQLAGRRIPSL